MLFDYFCISSKGGGQLITFFNVFLAQVHPDNLLLATFFPQRGVFSVNLLSREQEYVTSHQEPICPNLP